MLLGLNDLIKLLLIDLSRMVPFYMEQGEVYLYLTGVVVAQRRTHLANTDMQYTCFIQEWFASKSLIKFPFMLQFPWDRPGSNTTHCGISQLRDSDLKSLIQAIC